MPSYRHIAADECGVGVLSEESCAQRIAMYSAAKAPREETFVENAAPWSLFIYYYYSDPVHNR